MGGSSSKISSAVTIPKNSIPISHWAIPVFGTFNDTEMIYQSLFLGDPQANPNSTGYFLYTPKDIQTSTLPQFQNDAVLESSSRAHIDNRTFFSASRRTQPFASSQRFEFETETPSIGRATLGGGSGSLKKQLRENNNQKSNTDSVGDYSGVHSGPTTTASNPDQANGSGNGSVSSPGVFNASGKLAKEAMLLQFFRTSEVQVFTHDKFHSMYSHITKEDFQVYYPELTTKIKNVQSLAKMSKPDFLNTQQVLALSLAPIPSETNSFPALFGAIFNRLAAIPHIPFFLFSVDSTNVANIDRFFGHLQLIHLALNSNPALQTALGNTPMHVLLLNNIEDTGDAIKNINIALWESDLKHYCSQLGLDNVQIHRFGSADEIRNSSGLFNLRLFLDALLLHYFIRQYQPTTTPYLLDFAPTVTTGDKRDELVSGTDGDDALTNSVSIAAFGQSSSILAYGGSKPSKNNISSRSTTPTNAKSNGSMIFQQGGAGKGGNDVVGDNNNSSAPSSSSSWLSTKKTPYSTIPFPTIHPSFALKPALNTLNGEQWRVSELHTGRYPFLGNLYTAHLYGNQHDCHLFQSKLNILRAPAPMSFSSVSHTIAVSSQALNCSSGMVRNQLTTDANESTDGLGGESLDQLAPLGVFSPPQQRLPAISPFSSSHLELPQSTYITSSRKLRELYQASSTTMAKTSAMPKAPTKKNQVQFDLFFSANYEPHHEKLPAAVTFKAPYLVTSIVPNQLLKSTQDELASLSQNRGRGLSSFRKPANLDDIAVVPLERQRAGTVMKDNAVHDEVADLLLHTLHLTTILSNFTEPTPLTAIMTCVPYLATYNVFFINLSSLTVLKQTPSELWRGVKTAFGKVLSNVHTIVIPSKVLFYTGDLLQRPLAEINEIHSQQQLLAQGQGGSSSSKDIPKELTRSDLDHLIAKQEGIIMNKLKAKLDQLGSFQRQLWEFDRVDESGTNFVLHQWEQISLLRRLDLIYSSSLIQHPVPTSVTAPALGSMPSISTTIASPATSPVARTPTLNLDFVSHDDFQSVTPRNQSRSIY